MKTLKPSILNLNNWPSDMQGPGDPSTEMYVLENYMSSKILDCTVAEYPRSSFNPANCLLVWGCGEFGQHGYGHNSDVTLEGSLFEIRNGKFLINHHSPVAVASGSSHTLALAGT